MTEWNGHVSWEYHVRAHSNGEPRTSGAKNDCTRLYKGSLGRLHARDWDILPMLPRRAFKPCFFRTYGGRKQILTIEFGGIRV